MKFKKTTKKALALLMAVILCLSCALPAFAYEHGEVVEDDGTETNIPVDGYTHGMVVEDSGNETLLPESLQPSPEGTFASANEQEAAAAVTNEDAALVELLETEGAEIEILPDGSFGKAIAPATMRRAASRAAASSGTLRVGYKTFNSYVGSLESIGDYIANLPTKTLVSNGVHKAAYCLDPHLGATSGHGYTQIATLLSDHTKMSIIGDILALGYQYEGSTIIPKSDGYKWAVTQVMIWQVVNGYITRNKDGVNEFKPACTGADLEKQATAIGNNQYSDYYAYYCGLKNKLVALRKIPAFAFPTDTGAAVKPWTIPAKDDGTFSSTLNDTNKVLETGHFQFNFDDPNITLEATGNKMKVTCTGEINAPVVTQEAKYVIKGGEDSVVGYQPADSSQQRFLVCDPQDDPVRAFFAIQTGEATGEEPEEHQVRWIATKRDSETGTAQGDATLAGAVYGLYQNGTLLDTYVTNSQGQFTTSYYPCGSGYTLEEISPSRGYLRNPAVIQLNGSAGTDSLVSYPVGLVETVIKGFIELAKHTDHGETGIETPETGAEAEIYLTRAGNYESAKIAERDKIVFDEDGRAKTVALPYGTYTVHQTKGWEGKEMFADFQVVVIENGKVYFFMLNNATYEALITVMKKDAETGRMIPAPGITFQIRDVKTGKFVTQHVNYPTPMDISYFQTDTQGKLCMPEKLEYGEYELVEYATAYGYVLDTTPVPFQVDGTAKEITVEKSNMPQKGIIQIEKTGDIPAKAEEKNGFTVPKYQKAGLSGVEFTVTAAEDISTPDGTLRYVMGEKIETLVTDEKGHAETQPLYLGKYWIQETKGKDGYAIDPEKKLVTLKYTNQEESIQYQSLALENKRRELRVEKVDKQFSGRRLTGALFDLWYDKDGDKKLDKEKDDLFGELTETSTGIYSLSYLPVGGFFLVETQAPALYKLDETPEYFEVRSTDVLIKREVRNEVKTGSLKILKTAEDSKVEGITFLVSGKPLAGGTYEEEFVTDENGEIFISELPIGEYTVSEVLDEESVRYVLPADQSATIIYGETAEASFYNKLRRGEVYVIKTDPDYPESKLNGAKFKVWRDTNENGKYDEREPVVGVLQEEDGTYWLDGLENGSYLLREEIAPEGYLADDNYYAFTVSANKQQVEVTNAPDPEAGFINRKLLGSLTITKESTSGAKLSGANFCLKNKDGEVIAEGTTDKDGKLVFEELPCGEYVYQEICAPAGYETDDTEHKVSIAAEKLHVEVTALNEQTPFYVPKTGDGRMNPAFYWILLIFCTVGACAVIFLMSRAGKKKYKEKK